MSETESQRQRRRLINLGELIALAALIVSALGVWIAWKSSSEDKPTRIVEQRSTVPLALRGTPDSDGRTLTFMPADPSHALESLTVSIKGAPPIEVGSDGRLFASDVESALKDRDKEAKDVTHSVPVRIAARYVESGADRRGGGAYVLRYRWEGGGLFGDRSLRLAGISRG
ncbi:MAG: hypothetical protein ACJ8FL_02960 [Sphingomicrobium sp.]